MLRRKTNLEFRGMAWTFWVRDLLSPPEKMLEESGIAEGMRVLDYGCGPGSYTIAAARMIGQSGRVIAVDMHPLAIRMVVGKAARENLKNIETILSDKVPPLESESIDLVILYDVFHAIAAPAPLLADIHRVLKPSHTLSFSDHHLKKDVIISTVTRGGLFRLVREGKKTLTFERA